METCLRPEFRQACSLSNVAAEGLVFDGLQVRRTGTNSSAAGLMRVSDLLRIDARCSISSLRHCASVELQLNSECLFDLDWIQLETALTLVSPKFASHA